MGIISPLYYADRSLEVKFKSHIFPAELAVYRFLILFGALIYGGFYIVDLGLISGNINNHFIYRLIIVLPSSILFFGLSFTKYFMNSLFLRRSSIISSVFVGQLLHIFMSLNEGVPDFYYLMVTFLLVIWVYAFMTISFLVKLLFGVVNVVLLYLYLKFHLDVDDSIVHIQMFTFITVNIISLYSAYKNEVGSRKDFLLSMKINENTSGFSRIEQVTSHELKTSMRIINGLSYIMTKDEEENLSEKSQENIVLIRDHINQLNANIDLIQKEASQFD